MNHSHRIGAAGMVAAVAIAAVIAFGAASALAKPTTTLRLFVKSVAFGMFQANGQPITNPSAQPKPGDYLIGTDADYVGNHKMHAKTPTGSDNAVCAFTTATKAICDEVIAIGGSLLLSDHVTVNFSLKSPMSKITGGTGQFQAARGTITVTPIAPTNNSDFTIRYATRR